jgi:hypothetical protein
MCDWLKQHQKSGSVLHDYFLCNEDIHQPIQSRFAAIFWPISPEAIAACLRAD